MAQKPRQTRINRYKKQNGKGGTALAVFLVLILLLMIGSYYFLVWQRQQSPVVNLQQYSAPLPASSPAQTVPPADHQIMPAREAGPEWEHYTDDTGHDSMPATPQQPRQGGVAELAIIVDDMGSSLQEARNLIAIGVPITFSVIPGLRYDGEVAALAEEQGTEVMLHLPMQSKEYPRRRLESNGLLLDHDEKQLQQLVQGYFEQLPRAVGANNHTGSAFTEDAERMRTVLSMLKQKGLFFVDSVTTPATTGSRIAAELQIKSARRDVFLDNEHNEAYIQGQLAKAVSRARKTGRAIAICHPHPVTIATLAKALPGLRQQGVTLVFASKLVR